MEHRLRSPSRTYSDMPETNRVNVSERPQSQHSPAQSNNATETEQSNAMLQARINGIFVPSSEYAAEALLLGEDTPTPESTTTVTATSDWSQSDNPRPGCSRDSGSRGTEGLRQKACKGNSGHQCAIVRPSTSISSVKNDTPPETSGATAVAPGNYDDIEVIVVEDSDSDSDSHSSADSSTTRNFFKESRLPYSAAEDEEILKFVLMGSNIEKTSSILLWKELEARKGNPKRTYQSLKNRFLRNIKPFVLTRFKHLLSPESLKMLRKKFPELRITDAKKYTPTRPYEKRVVCVNPSLEGVQRPNIVDTHFGLINFTSVVDQEESEPEKEQEKNERSSIFSGVVNPQMRERRDTAADGEAMEYNEESTDSRANDDADEMNQVLPEPGPTHQLERVVNIFAKEKLVDAPVQSFKYYDTIGAFSNKAAVNLKLILDRSGAASLPAELPVNVSVIVTVGKEDENKTEKRSNSVASKDRGNQRSKKEWMKRKGANKASGKGLHGGYVLKVKEKYIKKFHNNSLWYIKAANSMLYKAELEKLLQDMKSNPVTFSSSTSYSDADPEITTDENAPESNSQYTNCSTEDESCYTQTLKKVSHIYKVEVKPTQSLIEDESEEFSVGAARTPPPVGNPPVADRGTLVADAVLMRGGPSPSARSLYQSFKI